MKTQSEVRSTSFTVPIGAIGGFFTLILITSFLDLVSAEKAAEAGGWFLKLAIGVPWALGLLAGATLWIGGKKEQLNTDAASGLLMVTASIISFAYEAMKELSKLHH